MTEAEFVPTRSSDSKTNRKKRILPRLRSIIEDFTGLTESEIDDHASFLELGLDSLMLTQANTEFQREYGIKITFRQLFESARTIDELADYIDGQLPVGALPAPDQTALATPMAPPATIISAAPSVSVAFSDNAHNHRTDYPGCSTRTSQCPVECRLANSAATRNHETTARLPKRPAA